MFTISQAREAIGSNAHFARGRAYAQEGRVKSISVQENRGVLVYTGLVRGSGRSYEASFDYDNTRERFLRCSCTCPAFEYTPFGCKHVAALMICVCGGTRAEQTGKAEEMRRRHEDELGLMQEFMRRREEERRTQFVDALLLNMPTPYPAQNEEKTHLNVLLTPERDGVSLELRIGRERMYVVRDVYEFAARVKRRERTIYGKQLTFTHDAQQICPQDIPLFWHVLALADAVPKAYGNQMILRGALLDQTMRLLLGGEAEMRGDLGIIVRVRIEEGMERLPVLLAKKGKRTLLHVNGARAILGSAGAYFFCEEEERILCAFSEQFAYVKRLCEISSAYPRGLEVDEAQLDALCARLLVPAKDAIEVRKGEKILTEHTPMAMTARFYVDADGETLVCRPAYIYGEETVYPGDEAPHICRNGPLEEAVTRAARELFPKKLQEGEYAFEGGQEKRFELLNGRLAALERWGEVMVSERLSRMNQTRRRAMSFGLALQGEKLIFTGDLGGFTQEDLQAAAQAYRLRRRYVRLADGVFLSGEALEQAAQTEQMLRGLDVTEQEVRAGAQMDRSRAMYVEAALENREEVQLQAPEALLDWTKRLKQAQSVSASTPRGLRAELRGYQSTGLSWLCALSEAGFGGLLADDMGLGKTIQALAMLLCAKEKGKLRALVVCPASLQLNWLSEAQRFAPDINACALLGGAKERHEKLAQEYELIITSYDQARRDAQTYEGMRFTHVLLDEAQHIKNAASQAARAVKTLSAEHRFAMTGTPVENRLGELWSIFDFLMPGYLYSYRKFKERFEAPIVQDGDERAMESLRLMVAPFILRRMKKDVLADLPEKVETTLESEMTAQQRKQYAAQAAKLMQQAEGGLDDGASRMQALAGLTRLRQLCCDPRLCLEGYAGGSGKLEQCVELVRDCMAGGHRMLLFSQFTTMLDLLQERFAEEGVSTLRLDGSTSKERRAQLAQAFNEGEGDVFLISLKAGGTGLNLTGADVVIHYDPWWNTAAQNQATDRAYRIGQTKGVQVFSLIAAQSVEERIQKLQQLKAELAGDVLSGEENLFTVDAQTLRELLRP